MIIQTPRQTIDGATPSPTSSDGAQTPRSAMAESMPSARTPARVSTSRQTTPVPTPMAVASDGAPIVDDASTAPTPRDPARRQTNVRPANTPATSKLGPLGGALNSDSPQANACPTPNACAPAGTYYRPTRLRPTPNLLASGRPTNIPQATAASFPKVHAPAGPNHCPSIDAPMPKVEAPGGPNNSDETIEVAIPILHPSRRPDHRPAILVPPPKVGAPGGPDVRQAMCRATPNPRPPAGPDTYPTNDEPTPIYCASNQPSSGGANLVALPKAHPRHRFHARPAIVDPMPNDAAPGGRTDPPQVRSSATLKPCAPAGAHRGDAMVTPTSRRPARRHCTSRPANHHSTPMGSTLAGSTTAHPTNPDPTPIAVASGGPYIHGGNVS